MTLDSLIEQSKSSDPVARVEAVRQLGKSQSPEAFIPLTEALKDPVLEVRRAAAETLGDLGDLRAIDHLIELYNDEELGELELDQDLPEPIQDVLVSFGPPAVEKLLQYIDNHMVMVALGRIGDVRAFEPLMHILQHSNDVYDRQSAMWGLGKLRDHRALDVLISLAHSPVFELKVAAIMALGDLGDPRAVDTLSEFLFFIPSPRPKSEVDTMDFHYAQIAAFSLRVLAHDSAVEALISHAQTRNALYRGDSFWQLTYVDDPRVDALFSKALHDPIYYQGWFPAILHFWKKGGIALLEKLQKTVPRKPAHDIARFLDGVRTTGKQ